MARFQQIPGLAEVDLGQTVESPSINRVDVADGTKGRVIPLCQKWLAATVAFTDDPLKGSWFVDRNILLKYGLRGRIVYVCPVIRLNTDAKGQVLNTDYRIEYLRLSENVYAEFADKATEMSNMHSFTVTKTKKGEFSYVVPAPSNKVLSQKEIEYINQVVAQCKSYDVEAVKMLVLNDVARPFEAYLELAKQKNIDVLPEEAPVTGALPSAFGNGGLLPDQNQAGAQPDGPQAPNFSNVTQQGPQTMGGPTAQEADADEFNENDEFNDER